MFTRPSCYGLRCCTIIRYWLLLYKVDMTCNITKALISTQTTCKLKSIAIVSSQNVSISSVDVGTRQSQLRNIPDHIVMQCRNGMQYRVGASHTSVTFTMFLWCSASRMLISLMDVRGKPSVSRSILIFFRAWILPDCFSLALHPHAQNWRTHCLLKQSCL